LPEEYQKLKIQDILGGSSKRKIRRGSRIKRLRREDSHSLHEGGNIFDGTSDFDHEMIPAIMKSINGVLQKVNATAIPIGSGATPTPGKISGDLDMIVDVDQLRSEYNMPDEKDAVIRKKLRQTFDLAGFETGQSGTSVHVKVPMGDHSHQVDIMVVPNAANAAQFHTHAIPQGSPFKGVNKHQMLSIIAREKAMLWSNYVGLFKRLPNGKKDPDGFITSDINEIAKLLLGPNARKEDMGSVESIVKALGKEGEELLANIRANDPNWKEKS
jgi:hypothetical protein